MSKKPGLISNLFGTKYIKNGFSSIGFMLNTIKVPKDQIRKETFEEALIRQKIKGPQENSFLLRVYMIHKIKFIVFTSAMLFLLIYGVGLGIYHEQYFSVLSSAVITFTIFALNIENSLRTFQIRNKKLGMLKELARNPKEWYPRKITLDYLKDLDTKIASRKAVETNINTDTLDSIVLESELDDLKDNVESKDKV